MFSIHCSEVGAVPAYVDCGETVWWTDLFPLLVELIVTAIAHAAVFTAAFVDVTAVAALLFPLKSTRANNAIDGGITTVSESCRGMSNRASSPFTHVDAQSIVAYFFRRDVAHATPGNAGSRERYKFPVPENNPDALRLSRYSPSYSFLPKALNPQSTSGQWSNGNFVRLVGQFV